MASPTDIVVVSDFASVNGGSAKVAIDSSIALAKNGLRVHFLAGVGPIAEELRTDGITVHCLGQQELAADSNRLRAACLGLWNPWANRRLANILGQCRRDSTIVHFHQWTKALSPSLFKVVNQHRFPYVVTFHDYFVVCPNGSFLVHPRQELCHRKPLSLSCIACNCDVRNYGHKLWRVLRQSVQKHVAGIPENLKHGIYISEFSRQILSPFLPSSMRWLYVMNPIDVAQSGPVDAHKNRNYTFVGRLSAEKGGSLFADAAQRVGVQPILVGDGHERATIERTYPDASITGWVSHNEVVDRLKQARALVFPSLWYENQPLTIWLASSLGIPAIVSDECAAADTVRDGVTGLHFRRGDADDLAAKIRMLDDDALVERLSRETYAAFWRDPPLIERHAIDLLKIYRTILDDAA